MSVILIILNLVGFGLCAQDFFKFFHWYSASLALAQVVFIYIYVKGFILAPKDAMRS